MKTSARNFLWIALFLFVLLAVPALGSSLENVLEKSLKDALVKTGMQSSLATKMSQRFLFMGTVMIHHNVPPITQEEEDHLLAQAKRNGEALGTALGNSYRVYKNEKLQETAAMMMHAVRAGLLPETAAETFSTLVLHGYAFDASAALLHEAAEAVRATRLGDSGVELCRQLREMVSEKEPVQDMKKLVIASIKREQTKQRELLAQKQKEREARESERKGGDKSRESVSVASKTGGSSTTSSASSARASRQKAGTPSSSKSSPSGTAKASNTASSSGASNTESTGKTDASTSGTTSGAPTGKEKANSDNATEKDSSSATKDVSSASASAADSGAETSGGASGGTDSSSSGESTSSGTSGAAEKQGESSSSVSNESSGATATQ